MLLTLTVVDNSRRFQSTWYLNLQSHERVLKFRAIRTDCRGFNKLPPRSPDATPCDFFLWGYVKDQVYVPPLPPKYPGTEGTNQNRH